jgi:hypothetical protein
MKPQSFGASKKFVEVGVFRQKSDIAAHCDRGMITTKNAHASACRLNQAKNNF